MQIKLPIRPFPYWIALGGGSDVAFKNYINA